MEAVPLTSLFYVMFIFSMLMLRVSAIVICLCLNGRKSFGSPAAMGQEDALGAELTNKLAPEAREDALEVELTDDLAPEAREDALVEEFLEELEEKLAKQLEVFHQPSSQSTTRH